MDDSINRQAAINALVKAIREDPYYDSNEAINGLGVCDVRVILNDLPSAQPEQPPYVAEIEAEYQKAVKMPHIHKPLAKALYEVWEKHDREDAERRADG